MAKTALSSWLLDEETDPDGRVRRGLEYLASPGEILQAVIDEFLAGPEDWVGLDRMAHGFGQE